MSMEIERLNGTLLLRHDALNYFLKRHDVVPCVNCRTLTCLGKFDLEMFQGKSCLRHFRCRICNVHDALLMSKVLGLLIVAALDPEIMDRNDPYLKSWHIKDVLGKFLPKGPRLAEPPSTLVPATDTISESPLWLPR